MKEFIGKVVKFVREKPRKPAEEEIFRKTVEGQRFPQAKEEFEATVKKRIAGLDVFGELSSKEQKKVYDAVAAQYAHSYDVTPSVLMKVTREVLGREPLPSSAGAPLSKAPKEEEPPSGQSVDTPPRGW